MNSNELKEIQLKEQLYQEELRTPLQYFKHDCNAHDDTALASITFEHGMAYYGLYWLLIEHLYTRKEHYYDLSTPLGKHQLMQDLNTLCPIEESEVDTFIETLASNNLIDKEIYAESKRVIIGRVLDNIETKARSKAGKRYGGLSKSRSK